ncbi:MAG: hypothetical protein Q9196_002894 [Gyalolechia fulgens]
MALTEGQASALAITERVVSVFSIIGIFFILFTFYFLKTFHKPINRLIYFASFGNLGMNVACLIAENGISSGHASGLCTFQAFLIQMFLGVDAFWACCMAWNVYLAFFHKYTARQLRHLDKWYLLGCYGASFVPALTLAFIDTPRRGRIYGPAVIWCWITIEWDFLRIALLYGIVWLAILFAFAIYIKAGRVIYKRRDTLRGFLNPLNEHPFTTGIVTTSIDITVQYVTSPTEDSSASANNNFNIFDKDFDPASNANAELDEFHPYIVNVEAPERRPSGVREVTREVARKESTNPGAWLYARVAFLFFLSMLVIWLTIPEPTDPVLCQPRLRPRPSFPHQLPAELRLRPRAARPRLPQRHRLHHHLADRNAPPPGLAAREATDAMERQSVRLAPQTDTAWQTQKQGWIAQGGQPQGPGNPTRIGGAGEEAWGPRRGQEDVGEEEFGRL